MNIEEKTVQAAFAFVNEQKAREEADFAIKKANEYKSQKRYNADGTIEEVTLPEIAVYDGENEISVDTTVQPSKVYLQGNISEAEVLSSRSLQASPQMLNLQPFDRSEFQLNDFYSETPIENPKLELETIGDDENAE